MVTKNKNGFEFKLENIVIEIDEEASKKRSEETELKTLVANFSVDVVEIGPDKTLFPYELRGNIEYDEDGGAESEFDDGSQYRSYLTLVGGEIRDAELNAAVKDFFAEDCDFNSLIFDKMSDEDKEKVQAIQ